MDMLCAASRMLIMAMSGNDTAAIFETTHALDDDRGVRNRIRVVFLWVSECGTEDRRS